MNPDLKRFGQRVRELRQAAGLSQEELAERCRLHRTYIGGIERGERNVGVLNLLQLARALQVRPGELLRARELRPSRGATMPRACNEKYLAHQPSLDKFGLSVDVIGRSVTYVYEILDSIDGKLIEAGGERLSELVELANLSAIIGNLYRGGADSARVREFKHRLAEATDQLLINERQVAEDARVSWNAIQTARQSVEILKREVDANLSTRDVYNQQFDIGPKSSELYEQKVGEFLASVKGQLGTDDPPVAFHNGVFGMFEDSRFEEGTRRFVAQLKRMKDAGVAVYVGGGEGGKALEKYGQPDWITHCFTAGGTVLNALGAEPIPYLQALYLAVKR